MFYVVLVIDSMLFTTITYNLYKLYYLGLGRESLLLFFCCQFLVILLVLFKEFSSSSKCLGKAVLFYCGTLCFHIIILSRFENQVLLKPVQGAWPLLPI